MSEPIEIPVGDSTIAMGDLLGNMFLRQVHHKQEYDKIYRQKGLKPVGPDKFGLLDDPALQAELRSTLGYMVEELYEAVGLLKNKPWKQTPKHTDANEFYGELADAWHFFLEFLILAGMTPDVIARFYFQESEKNDARRASGY